MPTLLLDRVPLPLFFFGVAFLLCLVMEGGYRLGRWRHSRIPDEREAPVGAMVGSILALLALVLGFTFSLAATRFEARREVLLAEANAVTNSYFLSRVISASEHTEIQSLLRQYVDTRIRAVQQKDVEEAIAVSEEIHEALWRHAVVLAERAPNSEMLALFVDSLTQITDLHAKRLLVSIRSRVPPVIWIGLFLLSVLGMGAVGYQAGLSTTRRTPAMPVLALAFASVLFLIADLDRAQEGLLNVGQEALLDALRKMEPAP